MKTKATQKERIVKRLLEYGQISRNDCLRNFISRLSAYILELRQEGWEFEVHDTGKDFIYKIVKCPLKRTVYTVEGGKTLETYSK